MRIPPLFWKGIQAAAAAGLILCLVPACKPAVQPAGPANPAAAKTNTVTATPNLAAAEHVSVFNELMPPKGKDPFYPNSHRRDPVPIAPLRTDRPPPPSSELQLQGIVGNAQHRLAIINTTILQVGERDSVSVPSGRVQVKCLEIGEDYAVIKVEGEAQPKRLELTKKGF
jgi:hypothetical protein